jgi:hypothetical protein
MGEGPWRVWARASQSDSAKTETPDKSGGVEADHCGDQEKVATSASRGKGEIGKGGIRKRPRRCSPRPYEGFTAKIGLLRPEDDLGGSDLRC